MLPLKNEREFSPCDGIMTREGEKGDRCISGRSATSTRRSRIRKRQFHWIASSSWFSYDSRAKTRKRCTGLSLIAPFFRSARHRRRISKRERNLSSTSRSSRPFSRRLLRTSRKLRCGSYSIFPYRRLSVLSDAAAT